MIQKILFPCFFLAVAFSHIALNGCSSGENASSATVDSIMPRAMHENLASNQQEVQTLLCDYEQKLGPINSLYQQLQSKVSGWSELVTYKYKLSRFKQSCESFKQSRVSAFNAPLVSCSLRRQIKSLEEFMMQLKEVNENPALLPGRLSPKKTMRSKSTDGYGSPEPSDSRDEYSGTGAGFSDRE